MMNWEQTREYFNNVKASCGKNSRFIAELGLWLKAEIDIAKKAAPTIELMVEGGKESETLEKLLNLTNEDFKVETIAGSGLKEFSFSIGAAEQALYGLMAMGLQYAEE